MELIQEKIYPTKHKKLLQLEYKFNRKNLEVGDFFYFYTSLVSRLSDIKNIKFSSFSITNENKITGDGNIYLRLYEIQEGKAWDKFEEFISNPENLVSSFCVEGTIEDRTFIIAVVPMFNQSILFTFVDGQELLNLFEKQLNNAEAVLYSSLGEENEQLN